MTKKMDHPSCCLFMEVWWNIGPVFMRLLASAGHTSRPTDFSWAPGEAENWTVASASEDNVVMVWQPTMRVWAGDEVKIDEKELEAEAMEGIEVTGSSGASYKTKESGAIADD